MSVNRFTSLSELGSGKQDTDIWNFLNISGLGCLCLAIISRHNVNLESGMRTISNRPVIATDHEWTLRFFGRVGSILKLLRLDPSIHNHTDSVLTIKVRVS